MAYVIKAGLGLVLFIGSIIVFNLALQDVLDIGTCASGNVPYQITQPCPEGTGTKIMLLMGSVVVGLIGCALFAFRGEPPWGGRRRSFGAFGWGTLAWGIFFAGTGLALLLGGPYGEATDPDTGEVVGRADSQLGATITGVTFLVMGVPALLIGLWSTFKGLAGGRDERPAGVPAGGAVAPPAPAATASRPSGDAIGRIERLQKLRESGALSDAEFEREKAKILGE